jgi:hypothetical protein
MVGVAGLVLLFCCCNCNSPRLFAATRYYLIYYYLFIYLCPLLPGPFQGLPAGSLVVWLWDDFAKKKNKMTLKYCLILELHCRDNMCLPRVCHKKGTIHRLLINEANDRTRERSMWFVAVACYYCALRLLRQRCSIPTATRTRKSGTALTFALLGHAMWLIRSHCTPLLSDVAFCLYAFWALVSRGTVSK